MRIILQTKYKQQCFERMDKENKSRSFLYENEQMDKEN